MFEKKFDNRMVWLVLPGTYLYGHVIYLWKALDLSFWMGWSKFVFPWFWPSSALDIYVILFKELDPNSVFTVYQKKKKYVISHTRTDLLPFFSLVCSCTVIAQLKVTFLPRKHFPFLLIFHFQKWYFQFFGDSFEIYVLQSYRLALCNISTCI